ncbi:MAG: NADH-quinone oxidoreductase subunit [Cypionkella sp.]|uniref:NADH-quinone oxidoreductase subunit E n=1 Tax=Cypionkella sp. TaxID=2811411 RepID=UPI00262BA1AB|nr:NADH-quinone oxidoreductase subunit E [Cypionkella sp.]MDB5657810.1 NADH-quinone oxidoreductase subunit [Cypionkella sp.]
MLRRLHKEQPASFAFTSANLAWAEGQIAKYPEGRQASAIIPLLWRAQEQEGWLTRPAIEHVADKLGMAYIRALEVATFYFMFQLQPVGSVAHIQICGTTSCMICGAEELIAVCKELVADKAHQVSADGKFSWEEVECLGACTNAPMAQIGKDYYEDLTPSKLRALIGRFSNGEVPVPGPQNGRYSSEPLSGLTSLKAHEAGRNQYNASVQAAVDIGDTVKRIDGTEVPLLTPWIAKVVQGDAAPEPVSAAVGDAVEPKPGKAEVVDATGTMVQEAPAVSKGRPFEDGNAQEATPLATPEAKTPSPLGDSRPVALAEPRGGAADDLTVIEGIDPDVAKLLNGLGIFHFDQIASLAPAEVDWVNNNLRGFEGRIGGDKWVAQARLIGEIGVPAFQIRAKNKEY